MSTGSESAASIGQVTGSDAEADAASCEPGSGPGAVVPDSRRGRSSGTEPAAGVLVVIPAVLSLAVELVLRPDPAASRWTSWAAPALAVLVGYRWTPRLGLLAAAGRLWRGLLRPYLLWLLILGGGAWAAESLRAGAAAAERARSLWWGGGALEPPLGGHWLMGALIVAVLLARCAESWLEVDPVWLLPAALALTYGGPLYVGAPAALGLGAALLSWVLLGRVLRRVRGWLSWPLGLALAVGGAAACALLSPVDLRVGQGGRPIAGPLAAGALAAGLVVLAERLAGALDVGWPLGARALARIAPLLPVALLTYGIGPYVVPSDWPGGVRVAGAVASAVLCCGVVGLLPRSAWLTGADAAGGSHACRWWQRLSWGPFAAAGTRSETPDRVRPRR